MVAIVICPVPVARRGSWSPYAYRVVMCVTAYWAFGAQGHVKFPTEDICVPSKQTNKGLLSLTVELVCTLKAKPLHLCLYALYRNIPAR